MGAFAHPLNGDGAVNTSIKFIRATQGAVRYGFGQTVWGELLKFGLVPQGKKISARAHLLDVEATDKAVAELLERAAANPGGLRALINERKTAIVRQAA